MTLASLQQASPAAAHHAYRPDIDGLRAVAVLAVVGFHAFPDWIHGGYVGVDVFFVISGFLISGIVMGELHRNEFSFATFYSRRIRRIFAALIVVLACSYALGWFALVSDDLRDLGKHMAGGAGFVANLVQWRESGYFAPASESQPLLHLWSLGIEEQFYLAWPLLLWLAWKRRVSPFLVIAGIVVASFAFDTVMLRNDAVASFYSPLSRFWELLLGSALAWWALQGRLAVRWPSAIAALGLALIAAGVLLLDRHSPFPGWRALLPSVGAMLLIAAGPRAWINRVVLSNPAAVWVGLVSYPLYLWHWPLLAYGRIVEGGVASRNLRLAAVAASIALAWATYAWIERPIRTRGANRTKVALLCAGLAAAFAVGIGTYWSLGAEARPVNHDDRAQFVHHYNELLRDGLQAPYHTECSFYDRTTHGRKRAIDPACVKAGERATVFLWGDSHAQMLSEGLRGLMGPGERVAQVATAGCKPALGPSDVLTPGNACNVSNAFALRAIASIRPQAVVMAQLDNHARTDWEAIAQRIHRDGGGRVILMGPSPQWEPSLPAVVAHFFWGKDHQRVKMRLDPEVFETDRLLHERYAHSRELTYISMVDALCNDDGCLAVVPGEPGYNLLVADYGHLTPEASVYVANALLRQPVRSAFDRH